MAALLRDIFAKPVDRSIDGVIKADDKTSLLTELDEYVITNEIGVRLEQFLDAYNNYGTANGVWISGFFGSGKSHLLKMLALLLENDEIEGQRAFSVFEKKLDGNPMLAGLLRKAVSIPSRSVLFNIDQKADVISKTDVDALLAVFQKVFDEMCGYYGKLPHIAQFERDLDSRGKLEAFKAAFEHSAGKPWERGREQALMEGKHVAVAFAEVTGDEVNDILGQYRKDTRVSIEDFANMVKTWIDAQGPKFRLNFFVDEVGQYIADNVKLMTNLQTIAESLNTKCKGQAWIIVTAQQDMSSVIGDRTAQQENDFSKIQARFANRIPLNSQDVAEVIQRRLLAKTDAGHITISNVYDAEENNLRTLFDFGDNSFKFKNFSGREQFVASYPFPNYQYDLFQRALMGLSQHNAFEGKHSSVGERSMLGVFQEVAKRLADTPAGDLATFDLMFEGIRTALKSSVQQSIQLAEKNLGDEFAVSVLKSLFLVKYVKEFKPTARNISILLLSRFEVDQTEHRRNIEEALSLLERQTLIQRNGEIYEFLTNEEKDVEAEIKAIAVDPAEIERHLDEFAFSTILRHSKIRHVATGMDYPFTRKLDGHALNREYELSVNIISPFSDDSDTPEVVRANSMAKDEMAVILGRDVRFTRDLVLWSQTVKFARQVSTGQEQPGRDRIIAEKRDQNSRREKDLVQRLRGLLSNARLFVRGTELEIGGEDPQERLFKGFQVLIDKVYTNLPMLRGVSYTEADLGRAGQVDGGLFGASDSGLTESEQEVLNHAQAQLQLGVKVSVKALIERFGAKPYGWPAATVLCLAASLVARDKLEARSDSSLLDGDALVQGLRNNHALGNILLSPQIEFTAPQIRKSREMFQALFDLPASGNDARALGTEWQSQVRKLLTELDGLGRQTANYPFIEALGPLRSQINAMRDQSATWFITGSIAHEDQLLDAKEDILDKIRSFMSGPQKAIYDDVRAFLSTQEQNLAYVDPAATDTLRKTLSDPSCFKGTTIQSLKADFYDLKERIEQTVLTERNDVIAAIDNIAAKVEQTSEFRALSLEQQVIIRDALTAHKDRLNSQNHIAVLRDRATGVRTNLLADTLNQMNALLPASDHFVQPETQRGMMNVSPPSEPFQPAPVRPIYVRAQAIPVVFGKSYLEDEADVVLYLDQMKKTLMAEIGAGKKVLV
ncbi:BREX system P-loop protein BrxC [Rhizobium ruizarguesonis]|uniref:BREX system P-loop protein BrxC n=1 Tax=Rhizobium ruizarguesonis TaxID=2081791 RepID=UPI0010317A7D|nr:BREX system P-loop protein BrxC [Rhizobium ruizarguesonis]TBD19402.1 BREX system P-loop protein BrxC [Rhizobium ruizarguesonis]TBD35030.1 BREX system P-loop protein BrxC [Rhizobium ruizarguesonis]TBD56132.1 BREX system P-loop protein BrxC [Rhizobium ruizarguesonis]TBF02925.1 BREX system P-loop protein BrxC [Rhizobium ruizarguesonis]